MIPREQQFYLRTIQRESVRDGASTVTRLYALTEGEPVLLWSSAKATDVERMRARILASLAWSDMLARKTTAKAADNLEDLL